MVKISFPVLATFLSATLAAPANMTGALTFPFLQQALAARSSPVCVDCNRLCHSPSLDEATACVNVCQGAETDKSECLNRFQRKRLALALFRDDAAYINMLNRHEIKDYLFEHLDRSIFADSKRKREDGMFLRNCLNCREVCDVARSGWGQPGDAEVCANVCEGEEDDECEYMDVVQQNHYLTAYYGPDYKHIPGLMDAWLKANGNKKGTGSSPRAAAPHDASESPSDTDTDSADEPEDEDDAPALARRYNPDIEFNCFYMCAPDSSVYNEQACRTVCKKDSEKKKCETNLNKKQLKALVRAYYPGSSEALWHFCYDETKHDRTGCFRRVILGDFPDLRPNEHGARCPK